MESVTSDQSRRTSSPSLPPDGTRPGEDARFRQVDHRLTTLETKWDTVIPTLATKSDLLALKGELKSDMLVLKGELKSDMHELRAELKSDMHGLKSELKDEIHKLDVSMQTVLHKMEANMHKMEASIHRMDGSMKAWMLGTAVALVVGLGGVMVAISKAQSPASVKTAAATVTAEGGDDVMKGIGPWNQ